MPRRVLTTLLAAATVSLGAVATAALGPLPGGAADADADATARLPAAPPAPAGDPAADATSVIDLSGEPGAGPPPADTPTAEAVAYTIDARYDPDEGVIEATERVAWRNDTDAPAGELRFHMYLNGFAGPATTWLRGAELKGRYPDEPLPAYGGIEIGRLEIPGGADLLPGAEYVAPDDGNPHDRTVLRVPLDEPVPPGGTVEVELDFRARMPEPWARTGRRGDYVAGVQWYPKLGVFEPGEPHTEATAGWNCPQFHHYTEFYGDYARFRVSLALPDRYEGKIAATGVEAEIGGVADGLYRATFRARAVHDFAWFADPDFVVVSRPFRGAEHRDADEEAHWLDVLGPEASPEEMALSDVELSVYLQPAHRHLADRHLDAMESALEWFGRAFGSYPYPVLRGVDPQHDARRTGGMEYPMVVALGTSLWVPEGRHSPEGVTMHEVGHEWFYGLLGSDEVRHGYLDEGFDTFAESTALGWAYGPDDKVTEFGPWKVRGVPLAAPGAGKGWPRWYELQVALGLGGGNLATWLVDLPPLTYRREARAFPWPEREQWRPAAGNDRIARETWTYGSRHDMRLHVYRLTALTLEAYRRAAGPARLYRALRRYAREHWLGHPRPEDFVDAAEAVEAELAGAAGAESGLPAAVSARSYFETVWGTPGYVDFLVRDVTCRPLSGDDAKDAAGTPPAAAGEAETDPEAQAAAAEPAGGDEPESRSECRVLVGRRGPWPLPVEIELTFEDGATELMLWDDGETWIAVETEGPPVVTVRVDPERRWVFDTDFTNNEWTRSPASEPAARFLMGLLHETAQRLLAIGWIG